jgi:hypothetical protein
MPSLGRSSRRARRVPVAREARANEVLEGDPSGAACPTGGLWEITPIISDG